MVAMTAGVSDCTTASDCLLSSDEIQQCYLEI